MGSSRTDRDSPSAGSSRRLLRPCTSEPVSGQATNVAAAPCRRHRQHRIVGPQSSRRGIDDPSTARHSARNPKGYRGPAHVALDVPSVAEARALVERLDGIVSFFKPGLWLAFTAGFDGLLDELLKRGKKIIPRRQDVRHRRDGQARGGKSNRTRPQLCHRSRRR